METTHEVGHQADVLAAHHLALDSGRVKNAHQALSRLTWVLGLEPRKLGGFERLCVEVAREARARHVHLDFVVESEPAPVVAAALKAQSASWHVVPRLGALGPRATIALSWHLWRTKPDAVHLHFCEFFVPFFVVARCLGIRLISTYHVSGAPARSTPIRRAWKRLRHALFNGSLTGITAVSESARRKFVSDYWEQTDRVSIIYNGIARRGVLMPCSDALPARERGSPRVIFVGALIREKGVHVAINALAAVRRTRPDMTLTIVGDGPERAHLEQLAARVGVADSVAFLGLRDDVLQLFADHDVAVVPSLWPEAFGFVILEAMAANCPVIASAVGGIPEIIRDKEHGVLVPPDDANALAVAIVQLWDAPEQRERIVASALARVDSVFSLDRVVADYWTEYDRAFTTPNSGFESARTASTQRPDKGASVSSSEVVQRPVLFLAYHFHPSNAIASRRCTALAQHLAAQRRPVIVVSALEGSDNPVHAPEVEGLTTIHVPPLANSMLDGLVRVNRSMRDKFVRLGVGPVTASSSRSSAAARYFWSVANIVDRYKHWSWRAAGEGVRVARESNAQAVVVSGPPWSSVVAAWWVSIRCKLPLVVDFRDPWTDWTSYDSQRFSASRSINRWLEAVVLDNAAAVVCTAPALARRLAARRPEIARKVHVVMNGYDGAARDGSTSTGHRLSMLFAGELYVNRDPFPLLRALEDLLARPEIDQSRVDLTFVGQCDEYKGQRLADWLKGKRCETVVHVLPPASAKRVDEMAEASSLLLNFAQRSPLAIPAKTFEHLARGREILVFCDDDSDTARMVTGMRGVIRADSDDVGAITDTLADLYHRHAVLNTLTPPEQREIARFSRRFQNERFVEILDSVCDTTALASSMQH